MFAMTPQILARIDAVDAVHRTALFDMFAAAFDVPAADVASAYAAAAAARDAAAARVAFGETVAAYSLPKTTAALALKAAALGASLAFVVKVDPETGEPESVSLTVTTARAAAANVTTAGRKPNAFDGAKVRAREGKAVNTALHGVKDGKLKGTTGEQTAAANVLASTGPGKIRETYRRLGAVMTRGKDKGTLPSEESSRNAWQALKALAVDVGGDYASLLARFSYVEE